METVGLRKPGVGRLEARKKKCAALLMIESGPGLCDLSFSASHQSEISGWFCC